jgi:uncharacterized protein with ParB-like and HNH nuclease domain
MSEMNVENPRIRPISELIGEKFFVPRYQRGYRWGKQEITELLDDILEYYEAAKPGNNEIKSGKFYCLQPIVVKKRKCKNEDHQSISVWELIDGQQRLTTILIILTYLEDIRQFHDNKTEIYSIDFETRRNCNSFFKDKEFVDHINDSNVDFYHISRGYKYVKDWFNDKLTFRLNILKTILEKESNVSIIWYEAEDDSNSSYIESSSIDLFTRLNEGKIPLTDSELIKALLLQSDRYPISELRYAKQRLFEIASEWDEIEASLQDEKFWLFLNDDTYNPSSKIEFVFKLLADEWNKDKRLIQYEDKDGKPKHYEYLVFDKYLIEKRLNFEKDTNPNKEILDPVNEVWKEIKETYSKFSEWYEDHNLYHYIGYLLAIDEKNKVKLIKELLQNEAKKNVFIDILKKKIANAVNIKKKKKENSTELKKLADLSYGEDNDEIIKVLLLLNIETLIKYSKENARFSFHLYKKEKITSIEHIHPQNPENIDTNEDRSVIWLKLHRNSLQLFIIKEEMKEKYDSIILSIDKLLIKFNIDEFKITYSDILELYSKMSEIKENEVHTLYNLALVDKDTNSTLNNSFFDIKREILKENKLGKYIPICTQRAFSKYYSSSPQEMIFWSNEDRNSYFRAIKKMYNSYIKLLEVKQ